MAILNQAKYLSFDHVYAETVVITDPSAMVTGVNAYRFVNRTGAYPVAGGYAAGATIYNVYGSSSLTGYESIALTGTLAITVTTGAVTGNGTQFATELAIGSIITVAGIEYRVVSIASATSMVVERVDGAAVTAVSAGATATRVVAKGGYNVEPPVGLSLTYEDRMNASTTPLAPRVFPYQKNLTVVTNGIVVVEVGPSQTIAVDAAIYSDASGRASTTAGAGVVMGRALDSLTTGAGDSGYIRVKLGNTAGA